jgi:sec-independent protein translocase protein TatB
MFGVGTGEILLVLVIAMLVVGPERMVAFARDMGQLLAHFRQETDSVTREFRDALSVEPGAEEEGEGEAAAATPVAEGEDSPAVSTAEEATGAGSQEALPAGQSKALDGEKGEGEVEPVPTGASTQAFIDGEREAFAPPSKDGKDDEPVLIIVGEPVPKDEDVEPTVIEGPVLVIGEEDAEGEEQDL